MIPALSRGHGDAVFHGPLMLQHVSPADALVAFVLGCLQGCLCSEQPWEIEAGPPTGAESWRGGFLFSIIKTMSLSSRELRADGCAYTQIRVWIP